MEDTWSTDEEDCTNNIDDTKMPLAEGGREKEREKNALYGNGRE